MNIINDPCGCSYREQTIYGGLVETICNNICLFHGGYDDNCQNYKWLYFSDESMNELIREIEERKQNIEINEKKIEEDTFIMKFLLEKKSNLLNDRKRFNGMTSDQIKQELINDKKMQEIHVIYDKVNELQCQINELKDRANKLK